jgi:hypothetical protein
MQRIRLSIYWRSILVPTSIVFFYFLQSCESPNKQGAVTPERVVEQYLLALETKNEKLILQLSPEHSMLTPEIKAKILKFGGYKVRKVTISYDKSSTILWNAKIVGFYIDRQKNNQPFADTIVIQYQKKGEIKAYAGRWYLLL